MFIKSENKMNVITFVNKLDDITSLKSCGVKEIIISTEELSIFSNLSEDEAFNLCINSKENGLTVFLEVDILINQSVFDEKIIILKRFIDRNIVDVFRVRDLGLCRKLVSDYPDIKIALNLESGNKNSLSVGSWNKLFSSNIERVILSPELSLSQLLNIINELKTLNLKYELLLFGSLQLLYSERPLINFAIENSSFSKSQKVMTLSSEESAHKDFRMYENKNGVLLYHEKFLNLLENIDKIKDIGISNLRVDLRELSEINPWVSDILRLMQKFNRERLNMFLNSFPYKTMKGFHYTNKTDVIFKKLKNEFIQRHDNNFIGQVIDVKKSSYLGIEIQNSKIHFKCGDRVLIVTPEGKNITANIKRLFDSSLNDLKASNDQDIVFINYVKGVTAKSIVSLANPA